MNYDDSDSDSCDEDLIETMHPEENNTQHMAPLTDNMSIELGKEMSRSTGWTKLLPDNESFKDITEEGIITLSSCAAGFGVKDLLHDSADRFWKTNRKNPHQIIVEFKRKTDVSFLMLYMDYKKDESYCPKRIRIELGWSTNDIWFTKEKLLGKPQGWSKLDIRERVNKNSNRIMVLVLTVLENNEGGRDCNIRHFRIISPINSRYGALSRLALGSFPALFTSTDNDSGLRLPGYLTNMSLR